MIDSRKYLYKAACDREDQASKDDHQISIDTAVCAITDARDEAVTLACEKISEAFNLSLDELLAVGFPAAGIKC